MAFGLPLITKVTLSIGFTRQLHINGKMSNLNFYGTDVKKNFN